MIFDKLNFNNIKDAAIFARSSQSFDMRNYAVKYQVECRARKVGKYGGEKNGRQIIWLHQQDLLLPWKSNSALIRNGGTKK